MHLKAGMAVLIIVFLHFGTLLVQRQTLNHDRLLTKGYGSVEVTIHKITPYSGAIMT